MTLSRVLDIDVAAPPTQPSGARMRAAEPSSGDVFAHPLIPVMTGGAVAVLAAESNGWGPWRFFYTIDASHAPHCA
ncbi:hypothetical protein ER13_14415 [Brevundimonas sp. EAKA]|uniref:hypothetical protein n=1 Tax=Brevundimonas sp. EAKA TaxID=1495854 RepID=UPI0004A8F5BC|nr:hypothetical protein [Brevundimonas sp. EAKA]KDP94094.1 hypothetical protein ER13_14415 [Brevundimonas sp. EAKA]